MTPASPGANRVRRGGLGTGLVVAIIAGSLVMLLGWSAVVSTALWAFWPRSQDLSAFDEAVAALATTAGVTASSVSSDGTTSMAARVAATGEVLGRLTVAGVDYDVLDVGGQSYLRSRDGTFPGGPLATAEGEGDAAGFEASLLADRWVAVRADQFTSSWQPPPSPGGLAYRLRVALADRGSVTVLDEAGPHVSGQPTRVALTAAGAVFISATAPHRVLRVDPSRVPEAGSSRGAGRTGLETAGVVRAVNRSGAAIVAASGGTADESPPLDEVPMPPGSLDGGPIDITELSPELVTELFDDVAAAVEQLPDAADNTLNLAFEGQATLDCGFGGCTYATAVRARVVGEREVRSARGTVTLHASFSVEGAPAGTCSQQAPLSLDRPIAISCSAPAAGPTYAAAHDRLKAAALAATPPGGTARWNVNFAVVALALAQVDIDVAELRVDVEDARQESLCRSGGPGCEDPPSAGATPSSSPAPVEAIDLSAITPTIHRNNQARHIMGHNRYNGGGWFNNQEEAQRVLDAVLDGRATILGRTSQGHLLVRYDGVTGYNVNRPTYIDQPTNVFMIKGTTKPSVVPTSPAAQPVSP